MFRIEVDERIKLRPYVEKDAEDLFSTVIANFEHLRPFLHWVTPEYSLDGARRFIEQSQKESAEKKR